MSFWEKENDEENEENDDEEDEEFKSSKDRIIFLIDARASMKEVNSKGESHLKNCLHVALEVMKTKIVAQDAAAVGVMFFGSREKDSTESMDGVYTLCPLAPPSAEMIRKVKTIVNNDISIFDGMIGSQGLERRSCPLKQALWACSQMFSTKDLKKTDFKRIWIFTNDDNPNSSFPVEQKAIITVAKDCAEAGIEISLWHLNSLHHIFDPKLFYEKLLLAATAVEESGEGQEDSGALEQRMLGAGFDGFDALLSSVKRKEYRKRRLCRFLFSFGFPAGSLPSLEASHSFPMTQATTSSVTGITGITGTVLPVISQAMGIQLYKMVSITKRPYHTWLYARTNEPLKTKTTFFIERTGERLEGPDIQTYLEVAGTRVAMESEEMKRLKRSGNITGNYTGNHTGNTIGTYTGTQTGSVTGTQTGTHTGNTTSTHTSTHTGKSTGIHTGMRFLGCLHRHDLPVDLNLDSPYFIYPEESLVRGSNALFECFLRETNTKNLCPVVRFNRLDSTAPRLALLLPQLEEIDNTGGQCLQVRAPGFHVLQLPCADEIRYNPYLGSALYERLFSVSLTGNTTSTSSSSTGNGSGNTGNTSTGNTGITSTGNTGNTATTNTGNITTTSTGNTTTNTTTGTITTTITGNLTKEQAALTPTIHALVTAMTFPPDFVPHQRVDNPSLQQFYALIETIALNEEELDWQADRDDTMKPPVEVVGMVEQRLIPTVKAKVQWVDSEEGGGVAVSSKPTKRRAAATDGDDEPVVKASSKRSKKAVDEDAPVTADGNAELTAEDLTLLVRDDQVMKMTVNDMKAVCKQFGLPCTGTKAVLAKRISDKFQ